MKDTKEKWIKKQCLEIEDDLKIGRHSEIRMATATSVIIILKITWKSNKISIHTKILLYKSLVLSIILYGCEIWTLAEDLERIIIAFETKSYRHILGISY